MLVSIIFDSGYGYTARQASAVAEGARNVPGVEAELNGDEGPEPAPTESDLKTAAYLGQRVAEISRRVRRH